MDVWPMAFSIVATGLMGMAVSKLSAVETHLAKMNGRLTDHIENKDLHYAHVSVDLLANQPKVGRFQLVGLADLRIERLPRSALDDAERGG